MHGKSWSPFSSMFRASKMSIANFGKNVASWQTTSQRGRVGTQWNFSSELWILVSTGSWTMAPQSHSIFAKRPFIFTNFCTIARCPELPWTRALTCLNRLCQPSPLRNLFLPVDSAKLAGREGGGLTNLQWLAIKILGSGKPVSLTKEPASRSTVHACPTGYDIIVLVCYL